MSVLLGKLVAVSAIEAILMFVLLFTVYCKTYFYIKAHAEILGITRKPGTLSRYVAVGILVAMILFFALSGLWISSHITYHFVPIYPLNLILIVLLSLFDALFIDFFLLLKWPRLLWGFPEGQPTRDRMMQHIKVQFAVGGLFKIAVVLLAAGFLIILRKGLMR
jgi:hypothetical protein